MSDRRNGPGRREADHENDGATRALATMAADSSTWTIRWIVGTLLGLLVVVGGVVASQQLGATTALAARVEQLTSTNAQQSERLSALEATVRATAQRLDAIDGHLSRMDSKLDRALERKP